jgi:TIR domain/CHAT domain
MSATMLNVPLQRSATMVLTVSLSRHGTVYRVDARGPRGIASGEVPGSFAVEVQTVPASEAGSRLFNTVFSGEVGAWFREHRQQARQSGSLLRLCFRLSGDAGLTQWPFESMCDTTNAERLTLSAEVSIVRDDVDAHDARPLEFATPLRVLLVIAEPSDVAPFGGSQIGAALDASLANLPDVQVTRLSVATERALVETLRASPWHVIHFVGQGNSRVAARYGTLNLLGSDGRMRAINAQNFAKLCVKHPSVGLVLLQSVVQRPAAQDFEIVTQELRNTGLPSVVWLPHLGAVEASAAFVRELYGSLAVGERLDLAVAKARRLLAGSSSQLAQLDTGYWRMPILFASEKSLAIENAVMVSAPVVASEPSRAPVISSDQERRTRDLKIALQRKRDAGQFDTFMCHNVADKLIVKEIGLRLRDEGLLPWLDEWELRPGMPWQRLLEEQMGSIRSAVVFVGRDGIGPWQRQELDGFLREFARRQCPVIPVMLPGAPLEPRLPRFLEGMTWVDFRLTAPDPMARLVWGITGHAPSIE